MTIDQARAILAEQEKLFRTDYEIAHGLEDELLIAAIERGEHWEGER